MSARNRRLVPMPPQRATFDGAVGVAPGDDTPASPILPATLPPLQVKPPNSLLMQDAPYILLLVAAVLGWIYLKPLFMLALVIVGLVLFIRGWVRLSMRFPLTMIFVNCFIAALLGGRRRRW